MKTKLHSRVFLLMATSTLSSLISCRKKDHGYPSSPPPSASQCRILKEVDSFPSIETVIDPLNSKLEDGLSYSRVKKIIFQYGSNENWTGETDSTFYYFNNGRKALQVHVLGLSYDGAGYLTNTNDQWYTQDKDGGTSTYLNKTEFQYANGRMVKQISDSGSATQYKVVHYAYDAQGNLDTAYYSSGDTIVYSYANGLLKQATYIRKNSASKTYPIEIDDQGRLLKKTFMNGWEEDIAYDGNGNMTEDKMMIASTGQIFIIYEYSYDNMKNPLQFNTWDNIIGDTWTSLWKKNKGFPNPQIIDPSGSGYSVSLAPANNIITVTIPAVGSEPEYNVKYTNTYDGHGNLIKRERPVSTGLESGYALKADYTYTGCL